jgi:hypothetical protein
MKAKITYFQGKKTKTEVVDFPIQFAKAPNSSMDDFFMEKEKTGIKNTYIAADKIVSIDVIPES